jgi:hypothetical protein
MKPNTHNDDIEDLEDWLAVPSQPAISAPEKPAPPLDGAAVTWTYDDGGRQAAGYKGQTNDCVCRAIAIAAQLPYEEIYREINDYAAYERSSARRKGRRSSAREGVFKPTTRRFIEKKLGWRWVPTMAIGSGCTTHLRAGELPPGRLIVAVSRHIVAVVDGVIHDTHDPSRHGTRCVYGYWMAGEAHDARRQLIHNKG